MSLRIGDVEIPGRWYRVADAVVPVKEIYSFAATQAKLFVDDLLDQQQVVIKSLEANFKQTPGISGATILGDGTVALIIDIPGLIQMFYDKNASTELSSAAVA